MTNRLTNVATSETVAATREFDGAPGENRERQPPKRKSVSWETLALVGLFAGFTGVLAIASVDAYADLPTRPQPPAAVYHPGGTFVDPNYAPFSGNAPLYHVPAQRSLPSPREQKAYELELLQYVAAQRMAFFLTLCAVGSGGLTCLGLLWILIWPRFASSRN